MNWHKFDQEDKSTWPPDGEIVLVYAGHNFFVTSGHRNYTGRFMWGLGGYLKNLHWCALDPPEVEDGT